MTAGPIGSYTYARYDLIPSECNIYPDAFQSGPGLDAAAVEVCTLERGLHRSTKFARYVPDIITSVLSECSARVLNANSHRMSSAVIPLAATCIRRSPDRQFSQSAYECAIILSLAHTHTHIQPL